MLRPLHTRPFQAPSSFSLKESTFGVGFLLRRPPAKHQCTGSRRQPRPCLALGREQVYGRNHKHCFPEQTCIRAELGFLRRVSLLRMQLPEASFVPFLRWARGGSLPSWRRVGCCGHGTQCLFRPHPPSPERRACLEVVSSSGDHQQSTRAQEAGGSPDHPQP